VKYQEWTARVIDAVKQYHVSGAEACGGSPPARVESHSAPVSRAPSMPAMPSMPPAGPRARGLYAFNASSPQELSFNPGDVMNIRSQNGAWWQAELNGRTGLIPSNYVELV